MDTDRTDLPLVEGPRERADAARNRQRILVAAGEVLAEQGVDGLTVDDVATAAGVGVGTIYRRFGDRAGLIHALLDRGERRFQNGFLAGPAPLGPGADAPARLRAFLHAYVDRLEDEAALLAVAEHTDATARYTSRAYAVHHTHVAALVAEIDPGADADYLADALLAPLDARLHLHHRARGVTPERVRAGLDRLLAGVLPS